MEIMSVDTVTRSTAETAAYYESVLGLPVRKEIGAVEVAVGRSVIRFREDPGAEGDQHYAFLVDDSRFDAARAFLAEGPGLLGDGDRTEFESQAAWNARSLYFPGPDRSVLEVIARRDLPQTLSARHARGAKASNPRVPGVQPTPFRPGDLLSVSEVGIAVPDVVGTADRLTDAGIGRYPDGSETFTPAGHIDGMLILVRPGRTWFPTSDRVVGEPPVTVIAQAGAASPGAVAGRYQLAPGRVLVVRS
ncbi:VOC family protein [Promicromonospora vindobonensis]|uniref:VOC family protein n=1 Tax=Promicromonospora vindobonensis TaxID=195748 RepID=A0ABW5W0X4_9MICO